MDIPEGAVLVGYDGSPDSDLALDWADDLAGRTQRPLQVLISEVDPTQILEITTDWHVARMAATEEAARKRLEGSPVSSALVSRVPDPPVPELIAASRRASVVVVGARGHSLLSGVLLGSVSQHVSQHAHCPVVVVRPSPGRGRVVVGIDGSAGSEAALKFAAQQASLAGSRLTVIHAWRSLSQGRGAIMGAPFEGRFQEELAAAERVLVGAAAGVREQYPELKIDTEAVPVAPSRCLADASAGADLVVVGARGRGAFTGMLLGSTSLSVLHHAQCPVAVVR